MRPQKRPHFAADSPLVEAAYSSGAVLDRFASDSESMSFFHQSDSRGESPQCSPMEATVKVLVKCVNADCELLFNSNEEVQQHMLVCPLGNVKRPMRQTARFTQFVQDEASRKIRPLSAERTVRPRNRAASSKSYKSKKNKKKKARSPPTTDATKLNCIYLCLYCPFESTDKNAYHLHRRRHALFSTDPDLRCKMCSFAVSNKTKSAVECANMLLVHQSAHFKPTGEQANSARLAPITPTAARLHVDKNRNDANQCRYCRRVLADEPSRRVHESHHTGFLEPVVREMEAIMEQMEEELAEVCRGRPPSDQK